MTLDEFAFEPRRVEKPWGYEVIWGHSERYVGKELFVREGHALSLQYHEVKDETIYVQQGRIELQVGPRDGELASEVVGPGRSFRLPPGTVHRMRALEDSLLLEVSTADLDDVVRLEDRYGRA
ncbi:MAG: cupin domain-containing protein [Gaiellaceae bacterium]